MDTQSTTNQPIINTPLTNNELQKHIVKTQDKSTADLLASLYWIWDAFDRANMPYFLTGKTAEQVMNNEDLQGDKLTMGVRIVEWRSGAKRILDSFIQPIETTDTKIIYEHGGVPIEITLYEDNPHIVAPITVMYRYESFPLPNPVKDFNEKYV